MPDKNERRLLNKLLRGKLMEYPGYRSKEEIFSYVETCFPFVEKPSDEDLMLYASDDSVSRYILEHMRSYPDPKLPIEAVRYLHDELRHLAPKGIAWLLPSLLRKAVLSNRHDSLSEFLLYDLESDFNGEGGVAQRYSSLTKNQVNCLIAVLEYFSEEFGHSVALAQENVSKLQA